MFGVSERKLRQSKDVFARRSGFSTGWALGLAILAMIAFPGQAFSSTPDQNAQNAWITDGLMGVNAVVTSGSTVYLGGDFTYVGPITGFGVPIKASDGSVKSPYPKVDGQVWVVVPDGSGGWYIGGEFTHVGTLPRNSIAHILSDGTVDPNWDPNASGGGESTSVLALAVSGSIVYVGGDFTNIGGQDRSYIAALDATNGQATPWDPCADGGCDGLVHALAVNGSRVYVGGIFLHIGGQNRNYIAALNTTIDGNATSWNPIANDPVYALALNVGGNSTTIYAGGDFTRIGGKTRWSIAALNDSDGKAIVDFDSNATSAVRTLALSSDRSRVYVGGDFIRIGGKTRNHIAAVGSAKGAVISNWNPNASGGELTSVFALAVTDSTVYAGGDFTNIGRQDRNYIAALNTTDGNATSWNPNAGSGEFRTSVLALALSTDGKTVYAGGDFTSMGGQARSFIAAFDVTTGKALSWNPSANGIIQALAVGGSTVYAGGDFTNIGGQDRHYIAALGATDGNATSWDPDGNSTVYALAVSEDNATVYAGGDFKKIGGQDRKYIAALDADPESPNFGLVIPSWDPAADADATVSALAVSGSTVYAGGDFTHIGGQDRHYIAALDAARGLVIPSWDPAADADATVSALAVSGSTVYAGGDFASIGGQDRNFIAALDAARGLVIPSWDPAADADATVSALAVSGSTVYAGGDFASIGGQDRNRIAALDAALGLATSWDPDADSTVNSLASTPSHVFVGGAFNTMGGEIRPRFAQFTVNPSTYSLSGKVSSGGSALAGVTVNLTGAATMKTTTDASGNYIFSGLANGAYTITPSKAGYTFSPPSIPVTVSGADVTGQDFTATVTGHSVSGKVSSGGSALAGVTVNLTGAATMKTTTDASGNYIFPGLANGAYTITPSKAGYTFSPPSIPVTVSGANVTGQNFTATLITTHSISGTVTSGGSALAGVTVNLTGAALMSTTTDGNGNYSFSGLSNGTYTITPSKAGYTFNPSSIPVNVSGADVTAQNFTATLITTHSISGTVTSGGSALAGVTVKLTGAALMSTTTDANGNYSFSGLANGAYTITPGKTGYTFNPSSIPVNVSGADVTGQNFTATATPSQLFVFIQGNDDGLYEDVYDGSNWSGWLPIGGLTYGAPAAASYNGQLYLFVRGVDNALWQNTWNGSKWSGWSSLGGYLVTTPAAVSANGLLQLFVVGWDNALYTKSYNGSTWSDWTDLGGVIDGSPAAVRFNGQPGQPYVFVVGKYDRAIYQMHSNGSTWSGWIKVGGYLNYPPAAATITVGGVDQLNLLAVGWDNALYRSYSTDAITWSDWINLGGVIITKPSATDYEGQVNVFVTGQDHAIWQNIIGKPTGWTSLGGSTPSSPAAATYVPGS